MKKIQPQSISLAKKNIRKTIQELIQSLNSELLVQQSIAITHVLQENLALHSQKIGLFVSMKNEVQTQFIDAWLKKKQILRAIPQWDKNDPELKFARVLDEIPIGTNLKLRNKIEAIQENIMLPEASIVATIGLHKDSDLRQDSSSIQRQREIPFKELLQFDAFLVPCIAIDRQGRRLGRGLGYYDRFIERIRKKKSKALFIALAFNEQLLPEIPIDSFDQPVDMICTPQTGLINVSS